MKLNRTEDGEQEAVVEYCLRRGILVIHIPNEGKRSPSYGAKLKRMGMMKGVPDLFIAHPVGEFGGLFIEMKTEHGRVSREQNDCIARLKAHGFAAKVARGAEEAIQMIEQYLRFKGDDGK